MTMSGDAEFTLDEVVTMLALRPLSGGGWGKDMATTDIYAPMEKVSAYRLLTPDQAAWRSIEHEEMWTAYMGAPLQIELKTELRSDMTVVEAGKGTWIQVPQGCWMRLTPLGDWCLAGRIGHAEPATN